MGTFNELNSETARGWSARMVVLAGVAICAVVTLGSCKSSPVTSEKEFAAPAGGKPAMVYVADFDLAAQDIRHEEGVITSRPGPVGRVGTRLAGASTDRAARARELVDLMSNSLVQDLRQAGFSATRLNARTPAPADGWLLRGVFTEVQEGNRVRRAIIGFGQGQTDIQVVVVVNDLSQGPPQPLYELDTKADSGQKPGAAPMMVLSPYGAAARFVLAGGDLEKNVKQTAHDIAAHLAKRFQEPK
jgi:hypothetical protein